MNTNNNPTLPIKGRERIAFTLAEVLITLGIIGVIAAITLSSVVNHYQKQRTVSQLKKIYTNLNQAIKLSQINNDEYKNWNLSTLDGKEIFEKYWKPYLKTLKYCDSYQACGYAVNRTWAQPSGQLNGYDVYTSSDPSFILSDGTYIKILKKGLIIVDLNGPKGPNIIGKDYFQFDILENGYIRPHGIDRSYKVIKNYCSSTKGEACAARIMYHGWKMDKDYPW